MTQTRSPSIPPGLVVELSRCKVLPGASAEADRWMAMLNDRLDECVATLDRERMAIEIIFRPVSVHPAARRALRTCWPKYLAGLLVPSLERRSDDVSVCPPVR